MGSKNKKRDRQDPDQSAPTMGSKKKNKGGGQRSEGAGNGGGKIITDPRYSSVHSAPIFQRVPRDKAKVEIDSRFQAMFTDKRFATSTAKLDKRGRVKKRTSENPLRRYYQMEEEKEKEEEEEEEENKSGSGSESGSEELERGTDVAKSAQMSTESEGSESEPESEDGAVSADLESTTDTDEEDEADVYEEEEAEPQEETIPIIEKETHRLAVVNMDWRQVKAVDLYVLLSSFLPKEGCILSVSVYPSDFGVQRMKEEEVHGPVGLFDDENDSDDENEEGDIDKEKLRAYEKSRLRYYYAVVECDSIATADYLYNACDGLEFERSSNVLDLRFIPDSMEFKHPPRDVATKAPANYDGLDFETRALQQTDIHLTWDEDEPDRVRTLKRKLNADQLAELELKEFLASDESGSDEEEEKEDLPGSPSDKKKKREKYLALLQGDADSDGNDEDDEDKQDMEITFNTGLEELSKRLSEKKEQKSESVFEANLRKRREKKETMRKNKSNESSDDEGHGDTDSEGAEEAGDVFFEKPVTKKSKKAGQNKANKAEKERQDLETEASIAELELLVADETGDNGPKGYNVKRRKAKGKQGSEDTEEAIAKIPTTVTDDPRFSALFTSPNFAVDPTDPQYKRSAAYLRQVALNRSKGGKRELDNRESEKSPSPVSDKADMAESDQQSTRKHELSSLVRSLKMKSQQLQLPKNDGKLRVRETVTKEKHGSSGLQSIKKKKKNKD